MPARERNRTTGKPSLARLAHPVAAVSPKPRSEFYRAAASRLGFWIITDIFFVAALSSLFPDYFRYRSLLGQIDLLLQAGGGIPDWRFLAGPIIFSLTVVLSVLLKSLPKGQVRRLLTKAEHYYAGIGQEGLLKLLVMHWSVIGLVLLFSNHFLPSGMAYRWYQNFPAFYFLLFMEGLALVPLVLFQFGGSPKAAPLILRITICFFLSTTIATFLGEFDQIRWTFFSDITLTSVSTLLRLLSFHSWSDSARYLLTLGTFQVRVYEACSGMEGMALFVILFGLFCFAHRERLRFPRILLLFPIGALTIGACNILRITSLVLIGAKFSPEVAMSGFHSYSGWILFNVVSLAVILIALRSPFFSRGPHRFVSLEDNELVPYLLPFLTLLAMQFLCGAFVSTLDYLYPVRVIGAGTALWMLRGNYRWPRETEIPWAALGIGGVTAAIWLLLEPVRNGTGLPPWDALNPAARYGWLFFRLVGSVVTVPIAEELAFRGFLLRRIIDADFTRVPIGKLTPISLLGSSLIFGSLHSRPMAGFFAGLLFAYALRVRGRLTDAVIAHMTANAVISVVALVSGHWEIWS